MQVSRHSHPVPHYAFASTASAVSTRRRGIASLYLIAAIPLLISLLAIMTDIGHLWLARINLKTATEAGAIAGAQAWGQNRSNTEIRRAAQGYTQANRVAGQPATPGLNQSGTATAGNPNQNAAANGEIVLGSAVPNGAEFQFDPNADPAGDSSRRQAVRVRMSVSVSSLWNDVFGVPLGPYTIRSEAHARFENNRPRLFVASP